MISFLSSKRKPGSLRILLAGDDAVQRRVVLRLLHRMGVQADCAENGEQAVLATGSNFYSLVLMDCQMPIMDGLSAARRIREREMSTHEHVQIVGCSAHYDRADCLAAGMDDFIEKTCTAKVLGELIDWYTNFAPVEVNAHAS